MKIMFGRRSGWAARSNWGSRVAQPARVTRASHKNFRRIGNLDLQDLDAHGTMNPVGMRSIAFSSLSEKSGTEWNPSLPGSWSVPSDLWLRGATSDFWLEFVLHLFQGLAQILLEKIGVAGAIGTPTMNEEHAIETNPAR